MVEEPTVEIDWDALENFPSMYQTCFNPEVYGEKEYFQMCDDQKKYNVEWMKSKTPGHSIQDNAIAHASNWLWKGFEIPWTGPRWETDPLHQLIKMSIRYLPVFNRLGEELNNEKKNLINARVSIIHTFNAEFL